MDTIVFLDRDTVRADFRPPAFPHRWIAHPATAPGEVALRLAGATIAVTNKVPLREDTLAQLPDLRMIAVAATGVDVVDLAACRRRGIAVANVRRYGTQAVPEHALMLMLALSRQLSVYQHAATGGDWQRAEGFCWFGPPIRDLHGRTLGVVGAGDLGCRMAELGRALGMRVLLAERREAESARPGRTAFAEVIRESDVLSLHCPLTPETRGLIGKEELAVMKPTAILINTSRGGLVDEAALADALVAGRLGGAGLDVLSEEPPRSGNPLLDLRLPNLIVTPHVAWASEAAMQALADQVIANIEAWQRGEPKNLVT